jgi:3-oxoacyl-[acyl-carrier protein] reductase
MDKFENIKIGDRASLDHTITEKDIEQFVELTGDDNRLHIDKDFAQTTEFRKPVAHGMLGASFISTIIGTKLPGDGALWSSQTLEFVRPVRIGDTITISAEVMNKNPKGKLIEIKTEIINQHKQVVLEGVAKVKIIEQQTQSETNKTDIKSKTVIILGATGGIGRETTLQLAKDGYNIVIHYNSNKKAADSLKEAVEKEGRKAFVIQSDLLDTSSIHSFTEVIKRKFNNIYGFVNCSTTAIPTVKFSDLDWKYMQEHFDINIKSSFYLLKAILPLMEAQKYGRIVMLTSQAVESPNSEWLHYITSKAALTGFAKALAVEYAPKGININLISPGMVDTDLLADISSRTKMLAEAKTPLRRLCTPADIAAAVSFLLSDNAGFIAGETIRINGGQVMI